MGGWERGRVISPSCGNPLQTSQGNQQPIYQHFPPKYSDALLLFVSAINSLSCFVLEDYKQLRLKEYDDRQSSYVHFINIHKSYQNDYVLLHLWQHVTKDVIKRIMDKNFFFSLFYKQFRELFFTRKPSISYEKQHLLSQLIHQKIATPTASTQILLGDKLL